MRQLITTRLGFEYGERKKFAERVEIERAANIGCIMNDQYSLPIRNRCDIRTRKISFDDLFYRIVHEVTVAEDHIVFDHRSLYLDNSIYTLHRNFEAKAEAIGQDYERRLKASIVGDDKINWIEGAAILTSNEGSGTWGHWVVHNFPRLAAVARVMPHAKVLIPAAYYGSRPNFGELLTLFGINESRLIKTYVDQIYHVEMGVLVDYLYSSDAIHPLAMDILAQISSSVEDNEAYEAERILIKRTTIGKRAIANEAEFDNAMKQHGFESRFLGRYTLKAQINAWQKTGVVGSILGSDLTNIVFGPNHISIAAFTPSRFGDNFFFDLAAAQGYVWNELFCGQSGEHKTPIINSSFIVDTDLLESFLSEAGIS